MGNTYIKETIDKHQELDKQIKNNELRQNLIIFNIPITFEHYRQSKSYYDQISMASEEELANTTYNELYLSSLGIKITNSDVILIDKENLCGWTSNYKDNIRILQTYDENKNEIRMYKHFDWDNTDEKPIPQIISTHVNKIVELQNQIKELESQIRVEKNKILNLEYVKSKLSQPVKKTKEYIETLKHLMDKVYN
jgi:hypothetical protein